MLTVKAFLYLLIVKSLAATSEKDYETLCKIDYRDLDNNPIVVSKYCSKKLCIEKCCRKDEIWASGKCQNKTALFQTRKFNISHLEAEVNYSTIIPPSWYKNDSSKKNFVLVHNERDPIKCYAERYFYDYEILKDGALSRQDGDTKEWFPIKRLKYCMEYKLYKPKDGDPAIKIIYREIIRDPKDTEKIAIFETVGVMISSFFLLLVLIVYCLLPELRNLSGLVLMAYTFTLFSAFITKLVVSFINKSPPPGFCKQISPVQYYLFMSCIFWLSVISFDVWSGLRRFRIKRGSKGEELVRFLWYSLYAWGTPLLIAAIVITLDNIDISYMGIVKPPFESCFHDGGRGFNYYFRIPIGILIVLNIILFIVTVYNIWIVKSAVRNANSSKQQNAKFSTYAKLSVMMGVSWCTELIRINENILWLYILLNCFNLFIGVAIFFLFVWNKKILAMLCRKFNIRNEFTKKLDAELSHRNQSGNAKSTLISRSTVKSNTKDQSQDPDLIQNCTKEESSLV